jgi:ATP-binding cassette subfamily F protein 3
METNYEDTDVDKLARVQDEFDALGGYTMQSEAEAILEGLGLQLPI